MLRNVTCSGFKSFDGFQIDFHPGLNVIVGPNGSGKTNIIFLLEFLNNLRHSSLIEAVGQAGGAGSVFRRESYKLTERADFSFSGGGSYLLYPHQKSKRAKYTFSASIELLIKENTIVFSQQHLQVWDDDGDAAELDLIDGSAPSLDIEYKTNEAGEILTEIRSIRDRHLRYAAKGNVDDAIVEIKEASKQYSKSVCMLAYLERVVSNVDYPDQDLWGARSYNILPDKVRTLEDVASTPVIQADGSGLAATLYALETQSSASHRRYTPFFLARREFSNAPEIKRQIVEYSKLVNENVHGITVRPDTLEGKLRISLQLKYENQLFSIPFAFVSDGTAKWFALVTAVMTNRRLFAIEEPENFLHPAMQAEIVSLVRSQYERDEPEGFAIITTHSETILNNTKPQELIIVSMVDGKTVANRPRNSKDVAEEISRTGFGLGYFYLAGAVE